MRERGWRVRRGSHAFIEALTALVERRVGFVERDGDLWLLCTFLFRAEDALTPVKIQRRA
jgi:hypothetical protein